MSRHPARLFWAIAASVFIADQISKSLVRVLWSAPATRIPLDGLVASGVAPRFSAGDALPLVGEVFQLTHVRNTGAAFGLFPGYQPIFIATSLIVLVVVAAYWKRARPDVWPIVVALALVAGGSAGNLVDRAIIGKVTDFLYVAIIDFPVFNIADSAIVVGVGILVAWLLFGPEPAQPGHTTHVGAESESDANTSE